MQKDKNLQNIIAKDVHTVRLRYASNENINCSICEFETPINKILNVAFFKAYTLNESGDMVQFKEKEDSLFLCPRCQIIFEKGWGILKESYNIKNYPGKTGFSNEGRK